MSASGTGMYHESNIIYHIPSADSSSTRGVHASAAADPTTTHKSRQRASLPLSSSSSSKDKHRSTPPASIKERRAEQNRNSQRTFRERKERHLKELEEQVAQGVEYARQLAVVTRENVLLKGLLLNKLHGGESSAATTMAATQVEKPAVVAQSIMSMDGESAPQVAVNGTCMTHVF